MEGFSNNEFKVDAKKERKKKTVLIGIILCVIIIIMLACMAIYYKAADAKTFKLWIDDERVSSISSDFYATDENGNFYLNAKELAGFTGWTYQNGEYGAFTEVAESGYYINNYEASSFTADSNTLKKYIQVSDEIKELIAKKSTVDSNNRPILTPDSDDGTLETITLDLPVLLINDELYIPLANVQDIADIAVSFTNNKMKIYTQNYLTDLSSVNAGEFGCTEVSSTYENIRALAYGMMIAKQGGNYGVIGLYNGESILGFKYSDIIFCQGRKEFIVKASNSEGETVGIVDYEGKQVIPLKSYENISVLSNELGLYIVEKDDKYGILNSSGNVVAYTDYSEIGLDETTRNTYGYTIDDNKYMIYDNIIVVRDDDKYGLVAIEEEDGETTGRVVLDTLYTGLGCDLQSLTSASLSSSSSSSSSSSNKLSSSDTLATKSNGDSVLTIEAQVETDDGTKTVKGIVIAFKMESTGEIFYGVFDANSKTLLVPCACTKIYSITKSGKTTYYMEYAGEQLEFENYIKEQVEAGNLSLDE
jgi:hypothetical protein